MNGDTYRFESEAVIQLENLLKIPGLKTPKISLRGPTTIARSDSTAPAPGRFLATLTLQEMNLTGQVLGVQIHVTLNNNYSSVGAVEGRADPKSPDPSKPEPLGRLRSHLNVYLTVSTPLGNLINTEPVEMRASIDKIPPDHGRYRQYSPPRDLYDMVFRIVHAQMLDAIHVVHHAVSIGPGHG